MKLSSGQLNNWFFFNNFKRLKLLKKKLRCTRSALIKEYLGSFCNNYHRAMIFILPSKFLMLSHLCCVYYHSFILI